MVIAHGQKTRWLDRPPSWRRAWQVVVDPGTDNNSGERLGDKYTWFRDKYNLSANEIAENPALAITFDFKPVPELSYKSIKNDLQIEFYGYYSGNHAAPHAPKFQIYDNGTTWVDSTDGALTLAQTAIERILMTVAQKDGDWWDADGNVRIRILHPPVIGNVTHETCVNHLGLTLAGVTTTTTTSTTSTTTS